MHSNPTRFLASELAKLPAEKCRFQIIPVPFEASVSYGGGTAQGPEAILEASSQLELTTSFPVKQEYSLPSRQNIFTHPALDCSGDAEMVLQRIEEAVQACLKTSSAKGEPANTSTANSLLPILPILLGGEHTVTLGALRALKKHYGHFGVVQFDAHADLRDSYEGTPYSHACVMRRAVSDLGLELFQIGVRSLSPEEIAFRKDNSILHLDAREINSQKIDNFILPDGFPELIFITFDLDAFDASLMPATGTPEPGGLFWWDALNLIQNCLTDRRALGFDVVELAPIAGMHAPNYTAARLVHEMMALI